MSRTIRCSLVFIIALGVNAYADEHATYKPWENTRPKYEQPKLPSPEKCGNPYLADAIRAKHLADEINTQDLNYLWKRIKGRLNEMSDSDKIQFSERIAARTKSDKNKFQRLLKELKDKNLGSIPLTTSLDKLIGGEGYSGNLDDVITWLNAPKQNHPFFMDNFEKWEPKHNNITVLKYLLLYATLVIEDEVNLSGLVEDEGFAKKLRFCYPAALPDGFKFPGLTELGLYCDSSKYPNHIFIPNAGFVFGGNLVEGDEPLLIRCRGVDCSEFLRQCVRSQTRLWTGAMSEIWWANMTPANEKESLRKQEAQATIAKWDIESTLGEFQSIHIDRGEKPVPGDLIVRRFVDPATGKEKGGHVMIYVEAVEGSDDFIGVEANREHISKDWEGIVARAVDLRLVNGKTFVIRRIGN